MANTEHLKILKQGVEAWNEWRKRNSHISPDLISANLSKLKLDGADFSHTRFSTESPNLFNVLDERFWETPETTFTEAELSGAIFQGANLGKTNFRRANLSNAYFNDADLRFASFSHANLDNAKLTGADLNGADFSHANFHHAVVGLGTLFVNTNLKDSKSLDSVIHLGPSYIDIKTLYKSGGALSEVFLRGCGVPEPFIVQILTLITALEPIQFYTCFISFTEADDAFSERLYSDLQAKGVRCWRWKEDAKWGKTLMRSIDEAVRVYDKLIVICSEQSLNSPAVIREIERALQKEDYLARQGKEGEALFPIRLDDYIFTGWQHHRKADVVAKNVGDFRQWKQHNSYTRAFDRLLRDLKAEG